MFRDKIFQLLNRSSAISLRTKRRRVTRFLAVDSINSQLTRCCHNLNILLKHNSR